MSKRKSEFSVEQVDRYVELVMEPGMTAAEARKILLQENKAKSQLADEVDESILKEMKEEE